MASEDNKEIQANSDSLELVTQASIDGASAFLSRICLPAAEEFGLLLKDKVSAWRANNAVKIAYKAKKVLEQYNQIDVSSHPRIIYSTIENGSWAEDDFMQSLWAGLLASSCTKDGKDESNHILISILAQLVHSQAKLISYICTTSKTYKSPAGWIYADELHIDQNTAVEITGINDFHQLDRELDHLRSLGLIDGGFDINSSQADVTPTSLCLQLYVRSQGYVGSPVDYFKCPEKIRENSFLKAYQNAKQDDQSNSS